MLSKAIFISHAVANKGLADKLVDLLETGIGISDSDIFCSSLEGLGIPSGTNFVDFIRKQISEPKAVILLLTPEYFSSSFCLCELGASWILSHKIIPLLVPPLEYHDVKAVLTGVQVLKIERKSDLNEMQNEITLALNKKGKPFARWEVKRDKFLEELSGYLNSCIPLKSISKKDFEIIESKYKEAVEEIKSMEEEINQKDVLIDNLKQAKDSNAVKQIVYESIDSKDQFEELIKGAKKALEPLPPIVCEALYYHFRDERLPWPGFGGDYERDQIKHAVEQDFLEDRDDGVDVWSCPYQTGHPSILFNSLLYSLGDFIFNPLWG
ncbi:MAG: toll/interleukin-1 receptor domain-containing protein [Proteobacteria bacterium]|nr:toll/interleukin-1 receptor domain-containing protein [Pseudomonadota bacterium]